VAGVPHAADAERGPDPPGSSQPLGLLTTVQALLTLERERVDRVDPPVTARPRPVALVAPAERVLTTILFADVVDSTGRLASLGDAGWRALRASFAAGASAAVDGHGGRITSIVGDEVMATFGGPTPAVLAAAEIHALARRNGLTVRGGVHVSEVERSADELVGIGVHLAARVCKKAAAGTTWVTRTVRDLARGSTIELASRGLHDLKGIAEPWELFEVVPG
jgi:class 3 adenylate cyclase